MALFNSRNAAGEIFYFTDWIPVQNYKGVARCISRLLNRYRVGHELYTLHYTPLRYIVKFVSNAALDDAAVEEHAQEFLSAMDGYALLPVVPNPKFLITFKVEEVGTQSLVFEGNSLEEIACKTTRFFSDLDAADRTCPAFSSKPLPFKTGLWTDRMHLRRVLKMLRR